MTAVPCPCNAAMITSGKLRRRQLRLRLIATQCDAGTLEPNASGGATSPRRLPVHLAHFHRPSDRPTPRRAVHGYAGHVPRLEGASKQSTRTISLLSDGLRTVNFENSMRNRRWIHMQSNQTSRSSLERSLSRLDLETRDSDPFIRHASPLHKQMWCSF